jgi:hypothetical protein
MEVVNSCSFETDAFMAVHAVGAQLKCVFE